MNRIDERKGGKKTGWTIGVPQGLGLRLVPFSIMNPNNGTEHTFSRLVKWYQIVEEQSIHSHSLGAQVGGIG